MAGVSELRAAWASGRPAFGMWAAIPDAFSIESAASPDLDYICVDQQHGVIDYAAMVSMVRAIHSTGLVPLVRVPANEPWMLMRALDAGALGVIVPLVNDAGEAARAVTACRYPPDGSRSYGPIRASGVLGSDDPATLGGEVLCLAQVETRAGLENVEEICATPGLDGVYIGPADLALSLGIPQDRTAEDPRHAEAVERIRAACEKNGLAAGMHSTSGALARQYAEQGFSMLNVGADHLLLGAAVEREVREAREG